MKLSTALIAFATLLVLALPANAATSLAQEQAQGKALAAQVASGAKTCSDLSDGDFERVGEYVMGRMVGSPSAHEALNVRMTSMIGAQGEERMHEYMGERYTGCTLKGSAAAGGMMGPAMIGPAMMGSSGDGGRSQMMASGDWNWMMNGNWQHMGRADWNRVSRRWMGNSGMASMHDDNSAWMFIAMGLIAIVIVVFVLAAGRSAGWRRPQSSR